MGEIEKWEMNWSKVLNHSVVLRNLKERIAFESLLEREKFIPAKTIIESDTTGDIDLESLKSLVDDKMAFFVKLNGKYWFKLSPLGALEMGEGGC